MEEYTVTAIRHTIAPGLKPSDPTWKAIAEPLLKEIETGDPMLLQAAPNNPEDESAIAVYRNFKHIGYIAHENTEEVRTFLDERGQCWASVSRNNRHSAFWVTIPVEPKRALQPRPRTLPEIPLDKGVRMGFTSDESELQAVAGYLVGVEINKANMALIMDAAKAYEKVLALSICDEECVWMNKIEGKLHDICSRWQELGLTDEQKATITDIYNNVRAAAGDLHCVQDNSPERIFAAHLDRLRNDEQTNRNLFDKYCNARLDGKPFGEADKSKITAEYERLCGWLKGLEWPELRNPNDLLKMGRKVKYLRLSRTELCELYSVLLLIEKLDQYGGNKISFEGLVGQLASVFWGSKEEREKEARSFLLQIQGMRDREITALVKKLVEERKISDRSCNRNLYKILFGNGLYTKSEQNWNQQIK